MNLTTLSNSLSESNTKSNSLVYEYSLSVVCKENREHLTAAFRFVPNAKNWDEWLSGWKECGYSLLDSPQLINVI